MRKCLLITLIALAATACDSDATFYPTQYDISQIIPIAFTDASCLPAAAQTGNADLALNFALTTNQQKHVLPGDPSGDKSRWLVEKPLQPTDFDISNAVAFEVDPDTGADKKCTETSECSADFTCQMPANAGLGDFYYPPVKHCLRPITLKITHDATFRANQKLATPIENANLTTAAYRDAAIALATDNDAELTTLDANDQRRQSLLNLLTNLNAPIHQSLAQRTQCQLAYLSTINAESAAYGLDQFAPTALALQSLRQNYPVPAGQYSFWRGLASTLKTLHNTDNRQRAKAIVAIKRCQNRDASPYTDTADQYDTTPTYIAEFNPDAAAPSPDAAQIAQKTCGAYLYNDDLPMLPTQILAINHALRGTWQLPIQCAECKADNGWLRIAFSIALKTAKGTTHYDAQRTQIAGQTPIDRRFLTFVEPKS